MMTYRIGMREGRSLATKVRVSPCFRRSAVGFILLLQGATSGKSKRHFHYQGTEACKSPAFCSLQRWLLLDYFAGGNVAGEWSSLLKLRIIRSWIASRGDFPRFKIKCICSVIGISMPCLCASRTAALVVNTP